MKFSENLSNFCQGRKFRKGQIKGQSKQIFKDLNNFIVNGPLKLRSNEAKGQNNNTVELLSSVCILY